MYKKIYQPILIILIILFIFNIQSTGSLIKATKTPFDNNYSINSQKLEQGKLLILKVNNNQQIDKIIFNQKEYKLRKEKNNNNIALIPLSYWIEPGTYELEIKGNNYTTIRNIEVLPGDFNNSYITVDRDKEEIIRPQNKKTVARRKKDNQLISEARKKSSPERLWRSRFIWPVDGTISTTFGATRYVNGKLQSRHSGIDIAAPKGSVVKAAADGTIKLASELLVTGNTIIIDHGWNVFSSYSHLNNISVSIGQKVKKGDTIGSVGSTGFSTGSHLHWALKVEGVFINPEQFLEDTQLLFSK